MKREEFLPLYKKLTDDLKKQIDDGQYKPGDLLPSENELARDYSTTRATVRQALTTLTNMRYIERRHGKGSIVCDARRGLGILSVSGVTAGVGGLNLKTVILQKPVRRDWPAELTGDLLPEDQESGCYFFSRLRYINDVPILFEETFITNRHLPRFTSLNLENRSFLKILQEHYQVEVTGGEQKIWAITAGKKSKLLKLAADSPIVHMKRKLKTNVPGLVIYSWLYCNTANYYLDDVF